MAVEEILLKGQKLLYGSSSRGFLIGIRLALSPDVEGVTGKYWDDKREKKCSFRDPQQLDKLWKKLAALCNLSE